MADPMTREEIAAAEARCAKATPGPWEYEPDDEGDSMGWITVQPPCDASPVELFDVRGDSAQQYVNADFVAHARTDLPRALAGNRAYLDLVERIEKEAERQQYSYDRWKADGTASEATMHAAWHTAMGLRALLSQKEPTE